ncbi:MAG TPA: DUF1203 domain-containing protein [Streptosporangiaceae bacterium]|jgi:hypothetical protein|nr:DUF1203 domain-containing protein [Streptosporangiaceae bacterium]
MTGTRTQTRYEVRAIRPDVLGQLRVRDDAGRTPRLVTNADGDRPPLRCCLRGARPGEEIALVSYAPLRRWAASAGADPGPYDELGPVFIHPAPCEGPAGNGFPPDLLGSGRVFRAYGAGGSILFGRLATADEITDASAADRVIDDVFADPRVAVVHARAVEYGCFTFEIRRA